MAEKEIVFGKNLKALRKKAGYTRTQLAELIAYSPKSVEKWEAGASVPSIVTVCRLAEIFGVSVDSMVHFCDGEIRYLLGIDGGGTKTEFLLTDMDGVQISHAVLGPSNYVDIGMENTFAILREGIAKTCEEIDRQEISVFAGLAGGIGTESEKRINKFLRGMGFKCVANDADTANACEIALGDDDGVVVIMGTGSIAFVQHGGVRQRIGGWGYLIDSGGSGYNLGRDALEAAYRFSDRRRGSLVIYNMVSERMGKPLPDMIPEIYRRGRAYIASFSDVVFEAHAQGDPIAGEILARNVGDICDMILTGRGMLDGRGKTVVCGGLCRQSAQLARFFEMHLGQGDIPIFMNEPMVNGAVSLARKNAERG